MEQILTMNQLVNYREFPGAEGLEGAEVFKLITLLKYVYTIVEGLLR